MLFLQIVERDSTTNFKFRCKISAGRNKSTVLYNIAAAEYQLLSKDQPTIEARIWYQPDQNEENDNATVILTSDILLIDKVTLEDRKGNKWEHCTQSIAVNLEENSIMLHQGKCTVF
ncbi:uncharacterized protein LOC122538199 [Frieseomelitta varia]|uniref:uncharacterized protein LOC122538199 n=1 Tax=Frieseomelitta varia TaxID=561572 RepID=UPI001CB68A90|nr:uncharacterized protein LOC122538199 [Frieseomelitta varia]